MNIADASFSSPAQLARRSWMSCKIWSKCLYRYMKNYLSYKWSVLQYILKNIIRKFTIFVSPRSFRIKFLTLGFKKNPDDCYCHKKLGSDAKFMKVVPGLGPPHCVASELLLQTSVCGCCSENLSDLERCLALLALCIGGRSCVGERLSCKKTKNTMLQRYSLVTDPHVFLHRQLQP